MSFRSLSSKYPDFILGKEIIFGGGGPKGLILTSFQLTF